MPGTARILKDALSLPFVLKLIKSQTQPDGGEGYSGMATGYPVTVLGEEAALPRQGTANARGDVSRLRRDASAHRVRRAWWDESATQDKVLYPL